MPLIVWGVLAVGGLFGAGWAFKEGNELIDTARKPLVGGNLLLLGGVLYALSVAFGRHSFGGNGRRRRPRYS